LPAARVRQTQVMGDPQSLAGEIAIDDPRADDVRSLIGAHHAFARQHTPPADIHALDISGLLDPTVTFFSYRVDGRLLAIGALKQLSGSEAELKSMHTAAAARGRGIGRAMLEHLIALAQARGYRVLNLETGSQPAFAPAHALYRRAGFVERGPFGDYSASPSSTFLVMPLAVGLEAEVDREADPGDRDKHP
jgi:putative acetyltransferase